MNSLEILRNLATIRSHTVGVFPADRIPRVWMKPTVFVFNTDNHNKPGLHWVCAYVDKTGVGWYFDSYGLPPIRPEFITRLRKNCKHFRWNTMCLQSESSDVCGQFCIMFLHHMSSGLSMKKFLKKFSADTQKNDTIARNFVKCKKSNNNFKGKGGCFIRYSQNCCAKMSLLH